MAKYRLSDVAKLAGVSNATVSRVLMHPELVNDATRARVMEVIRETGYLPNTAARNLRRHTSGCIAAMVPDLSNSCFSPILSAVSRVLGQAGYALIIADTKSLHWPNNLDLSRVDAFLVLDGSLQPSLFTGRPVVTVCEWITELNAPRTVVDNIGSARAAVEHLVGLGHRRIGHVTGPRGNVLTECRLSGAMQAAEAHNLPSLIVVEGDFSYLAGQLAAQAWINTVDRPTGMFLASDAMAFGFIWELQRSGMNVPRDVSVVGFDDLPPSKYLYPSLSTVRQPGIAMGHAAADLLLRVISGQAPQCDVILKAEFVSRASTAYLKYSVT